MLCFKIQSHEQHWRHKLSFHTESLTMEEAQNGSRTLKSTTNRLVQHKKSRNHLLSNCGINPHSSFAHMHSEVAGCLLSEVSFLAWASDQDPPAHLPLEVFREWKHDWEAGFILNISQIDASICFAVSVIPDRYQPLQCQSWQYRAVVAKATLGLVWLLKKRLLGDRAAHKGGKRGEFSGAQPLEGPMKDSNNQVQP